MPPGRGSPQRKVVNIERACRKKEPSSYWLAQAPVADVGADVGSLTTADGFSLCSSNCGFLAIDSASLLGNAFCSCLMHSDIS